MRFRSEPLVHLSCVEMRVLLDIHPAVTKANYEIHDFLHTTSRPLTAYVIFCRCSRKDLTSFHPTSAAEFESLVGLRERPFTSRAKKCGPDHKQQKELYIFIFAANAAAMCTVLQ
jgi:hypothetical protein